MKIKLIFTMLITWQISLASSVDSIDYFFNNASKFMKSDLDSMHYYANKLKEYSDNNTNKKSTALYYNVIGVYMEEVSQYDSSASLGKKALQIFNEINDSTGIARTYNNLGNNFMDQGIYETALEYYTKSLAYSETINDQHLQTITSNNMGFIYFNMQDYKKSRTYHEQAIKMAYHQNDTILIGNTLLYLGNLFIVSGKLDLALEQYQQVLSLTKATNDMNNYCSTLTNIGAVYFFKNEFLKAIEYYQNSADIAIQRNDLVQLGACYQNIGEAYIYLDKFHLAEKFLFMSIDVLKKINHKKFISSAYSYLYSLYDRKKDPQNALKSYITYSQYKDSLFNENNSKKIAELETKYQTEKKAKEINTLNALNKIQRLEIQNNQYMLGGIGSIAILLVIATIALYSRKNYKLKATLAQEKEAQQKLRFKSVIEGEEKERKRIAQDLHDGLGQLLSTARLNVSVMEDEDESKNVQVNNSLKLIDSAVNEVRTISHNMMPNALISIGFEAALKEQVHLINDAGKVQVSLILPEEKINLEESQAISLYRIIQEIMNNALKYAEAENIEVSINNTNKILSISVIDNGKGFDTELIKSSTGIGWENVISRTDLLNGTLDIQSQIGLGSTVSLKLAI